MDRSLDSRITRKNLRRLMRRKRTITQRGCWEWTGKRTTKGYGQIYIGRSLLSVHRVAAVLWKRFDYSDDRLILHKCDNPPCFRPSHLYIGTHKDNFRDYLERGGSQVGV